MAKEHRAALREVLLMGVTRLVVEKGEIDAAVEFRSRRIARARRTTRTRTSTWRRCMRSTKDRWAALRRAERQLRHDQHQYPGEHVRQEGDRRDDGEPQGHVNIKFKTDYFKLDNFANMYGDGGVAALKPPAAAGAAGAAAGVRHDAPWRSHFWICSTMSSRMFGRALIRGRIGIPGQGWPWRTATRRHRLG